MAEPLRGWIDTKEAAEITDYSAVYVRLLARNGRVEARKVGRDWLIERASLLAFKAEMDRLGNDKHNPWREDLATEERSRGEE